MTQKREGLSITRCKGSSAMLLLGSSSPTQNLRACPVTQLARYKIWGLVPLQNLGARPVTHTKSGDKLLLVPSFDN